MPNELTNPNNVVTEERLARFYKQILPYLGGMPDVLANKFNRADLYSTDEKLIGRWIDGKPLYQKTVTGLSVNLTNSWVTIATIENGETCVGLTCRYSNDRSVIDAIDYTIDRETGYVWCMSMSSIARTITSVTIQYTKTTDSAVEIGDDTDYSTTEKIVGTWIDGKPIWQNVVTGTTPSGSSWGEIADIGSNCHIIQGQVYINSASNTVYPVPYGSGNVRCGFNFGNVNGKLSMNSVGDTDFTSKPFYAILQYTKTS